LHALRIYDRRVFKAYDIPLVAAKARPRGESAVPASARKNIRELPDLETR
jgi:hypothetical protein